MLVAGLGIAIGAALGAMVPASRVEKEVMGDASPDVQDRVREAASKSLRTAVDAVGGEENPEKNGSAMSQPASNDDTADLERNVAQGSGRSSTESEPQSAAPYAEAAEAGAPGPATNLNESEYAKRD